MSSVVATCCRGEPNVFKCCPKPRCQQEQVYVPHDTAVTPSALANPLSVMLSRVRDSLLESLVNARNPMDCGPRSPRRSFDLRPREA